MSKKLRLVICLDAKDRENEMRKKETEVVAAGWFVSKDERRNCIETKSYLLYFKTMNQIKAMDGYIFQSIETSRLFFLESTAEQSRMFYNFRDENKLSWD